MVLLSLLVWPAGWSAAVVAKEPASQRPQSEFFEKRIRPLLAEKCWDCHGPDTQESGLRLDARQQMMRGGHSGKPIVVPSDPTASELLKRVTAKGDAQMPPDDPLTTSEIKVLKRWIADGAPWPNTTQPKDLRGSWEDEFDRVRQSHWALQPIEMPPLPQIHDRTWPKTELDYYILANLETAGLTPSKEADRRTLIRRVTFDLWGLPPTYAEIEAFVHDPRPDAYERLVDRLLAAPRYGERWARHWLDVARYADTKGYAFAQERRYPYAYTYRDYVIGALNRDVPYDRFILEQLAADLLPDREDDRTLAALGFLTVGRKYNNRHEDIDDQIDVVSRGLLGLTVGCARCHDHKYDPVPSEDYYSLYGVFASCVEPPELPLIGDPTATPGYAEFKKELDKRQAKLNAFEKKKREEIVDQARRRIGDYIAAAIQPKQDPLLRKQLAQFSLSPDDLRPRLIVRWRQYLLKQARPDHPVWGPLFAVARVADDQWQAAVADLNKQWKSLPEGSEKGQLNRLVKQALTTSPVSTKWDVVGRYGELFTNVYLHLREEGGAYRDVPKDDPALRQLIHIVTGTGTPTDLAGESLRGYLNRKDNNQYRNLKKAIEQWQVDSRGAPPRAMIVKDRPKAVEPRVFIRGNPARPGKPVPRRFLGMVAGNDRAEFSHGSGRLELAHAIASPDNPLTARVFVHRVWMHHMVQPMVATPSDFGVRTPRPLQHLALDALATRFVQSGWSIKALHRMIVLSATYRQASVDRPECHQADPENERLWRMNRRRLSWEALRDSLLKVSGQLDETMGGKSVDITRRPFSTRRTVYAFIDRQDLPTLFRVFDLANPDQSSGKRPHTTVPQQALFLLNSPFVWEQARAAVTRPEMTQAANTTERVSRLFRIVLGREPTTDESDACVAFIQQAADEAKGKAWTELAQALMCSNEFAYVD